MTGISEAGGPIEPIEPAEPSEERQRRRELLRNSAVYLVTEESLSAGRSSEDVAELALKAGVRVVQVREKEGSARRALEIAINLRDATRHYGALLLIDDRIDIAIASDADGVHLGQDDLPIPLARLLLGNDALVGLSITDFEQLAAGDAADADYLGVGGVFPTGSKADATLTGLPLLTAARAATTAPIVAIGGIDATNAAEAIRAGADSLAVITAVTRAANPAAAVAALAAQVAAARAAAGNVAASDAMASDAIAGNVAAGDAVAGDVAGAQVASATVATARDEDARR
jgi:thiamine-phosphate pyrophosphorylase